MNRRRFLRWSIFSGLVAEPTFSAKFPGRFFPAAASRPRAFELEEITIQDLQAGLASGRFTAQQLARLYLERIEAIDRRGPAVNSVIEINPDALAIARSMDQERKAKGPRGPLHGVPILIKDNIATHDRMSTTAGSLALIGSIPPRDAFVVERLRAAGAVLLGKANLSEWANFRSNHSSSGWSGRGGQTRNPYVLDRNPCGSSSGSGVAVSANLCAVAVGTETDGSIVCPSSVNGIVGIKPTLGLVSRSGIVPIAHSQDTAGPMARSVADAAVLLSAMIGPDPRDPITQKSGDRAPQDYTQFLQADGLRGARIGVARRLFGSNPHVQKLMDRALEELKKLGAVLVDPADVATSNQLGAHEFEVLLYEFKADLNAYLAGLGPDAPVRSLKELIEFNNRHADQELRYFGQELFLKAEEKGPLTEQKYIDARDAARRLAGPEGIDAALEKHQVDALVAPTEGPACPIDWINGDHFNGGSSTPPAVAGYPSISLPMGFAFGLPVGISFFGRAFSEGLLIKFAYAFEQATKFRRTPQFKPTLEIPPQSTTSHEK